MSTISVKRSPEILRIGNGAGYWGDNLDAPRRLAEVGRLDYLTLEYLAELTLSILAHLRSRDLEAGFVGDVPTVVESLIPALKSQAELKIVTNGGGMNPTACVRAVAKVLEAAGLGAVPIAAVAGDDLLPRLRDLQAAGETLENFDTGEPMTAEILGRLASANAYLGATGIVEALQRGARVVVTGRVADASLTVGPAVHEFGWTWNDWQRLAAASVAGHLIECGAQATGGMYSGWSSALSLDNLGYPLVEMSADGRFTLTKPTGTGGAVTFDTVSEQLVYEIRDPAHYLTPDVDADFSQVSLTETGPDRVLVQHARGNPAPPQLKVSMAYRDGYMAAGTLVVYGPDATVRARTCGDLILSRLRQAGIELARTKIECLGSGMVVPDAWHVPPGQPAQLGGSASTVTEVVLRVSAHDPSKAKLERFLREFAPLAGAGTPGVTGYTGPRPSPYPVFAYWPTTISRQHVQPTVEVHTASEWLKSSADGSVHA